MTSQLSIGDRIRLLHTNDEFTNLESGAQGTVHFVDDLGTIHIKWDNGSRLGLIPGIDQYERV